MSSVPERNQLHFAPLAGEVRGVDRLHYGHLGTVVLHGPGEAPERQHVRQNAYRQCKALLAPDLLAAERQKLAAEEADPNFEERYTSGMLLGTMEIKPQSLEVRSTDPRVAGLMATVHDSPRLAQQMFMPKQVFYEHGDDRRVISIVTVRQDEPIELPLQNFVFAEGFVGWKEGRGRGATKTEDNLEARVRSSAETIAVYSRRTTTALPVEAVMGFVQPNGVIAFATERGSHRTAAAIMRGDSTIKTKQLTLMPISVNCLDLDATTQQ